MIEKLDVSLDNLLSSKYFVRDSLLYKKVNERGHVLQILAEDCGVAYVVNPSDDI